VTDHNLRPSFAPGLQGKRALITGGARGQGAAAAELFRASGATVLVADVIDAPGAGSVRLDVRDPAQWAAAMERVEAELGGLDVLVNNAGIMRTGLLESMPLDEYREVIEVNQVGCFLGIQAVVPLMRAAGGGSIVNISSVAGLKGVAGAGAYSASKWAIRGMTKTAALELGAYGIRVNSVHPGAIDTAMINGPEFAGVDRSSYFAGIPVPRIGEAHEVAHLVAFLASDASAYCSGAEFVIDGGEMAGSRRPPTKEDGAA
jgi:3alpha(or 20beta)-hydroxysteroid dehydrogenase